MADLDPRLLRVSLEIRDRLLTYENIAITAVGNKYANNNLGECTITLANLRKDTADYILSESTPFRDTTALKRIIVEAGRVSTGLSRVYTGGIFRSSITQPPDAELSIRAVTLLDRQNTLVSRGATAVTPLSVVAAGVATDNGLSLNFQATDFPVSNYTFTGGALKQVDKLESLGDINAYVDGDVLVVKDAGSALVGRTRRLDADTGMIGVPTFTDRGLRVTMFYDAQTVVGGLLDVTSRQYPAITGQYLIYRLGYHLTNRDTPFYYIADCQRLG